MPRPATYATSCLVCGGVTQQRWIETATWFDVAIGCVIVAGFVLIMWLVQSRGGGTGGC